MSLKMMLLFLPGLLAGITVHECAHAWSACLLGDGFARRQGRVSLNPLQHLSPLGTLAMFLLPFGWGKPVYVNLYNFRHPRRDYFLSSVAGPLANILMVALCFALMQLTRHTFAFGPHAAAFMVVGHVLILTAAIANAILASFNLIPIPPLDGSKIWPCLFPRLKPAFTPVLQKAALIVLIVLMTTHLLNPVFGAVVQTVARVMPMQEVQVFNERLDRAYADLQVGRCVEAEKSLDQAIAVNPWSADAFSMRAGARAMQEKWPAAAEDIRRALELDKGNVKYQQAQADILKQLPQPQ